jgi:hypothetical protein
MKDILQYPGSMNLQMKHKSKREGVLLASITTVKVPFKGTVQRNGSG